MKRIFLTLSLLASITVVYGQDTTKQHQLEYFIVLYTIGENWDTTNEYHEQLYSSEHSTHLSQLRKANKIPIGARYSDTGMIILKANNESEAQEIIGKDPAMLNRLFKAEIYPLDAFYTGCID
ncbi:MAG: hypothetical protein JKY42_04825 [Flavobacteriales bacterium]|nr:hypothetical protein [Flavobacteriales bacterium]